MSTYCVSDIHGRGDLFGEGLKKINFNPKKDLLYILGDVCNKGKDSLSVYKYIMENEKSVHLILGNHELYLMRMLPVWIQIIQHQDLLDSFGLYVENYVTGFEKNVVDLKNPRKTSKYFSTNRRKICFEQLKNYRRLCKKYKIDDGEFLLKFYEKWFCVKNLLRECLSNIDFDYVGLLEYLSKCKKIDSIIVNNQEWVMYHCEYSEDNGWMGKQLISRISLAQKTKNVNYIFGHTPIPMVTKQIVSGLSLNYNMILKAIDTNDNKYYNIDVSHYGICFLRLDDLNETYCGLAKEKKFGSKIVYHKNYSIQDVTDYDSIYSQYRYMIRKDAYLYYLVVVPIEKIRDVNVYEMFDKSFDFFEVAKMFNYDERVTINNEEYPDMESVLKIFLKKVENQS